MWVSCGESSEHEKLFFVVKNLWNSKYSDCVGGVGRKTFQTSSNILKVVMTKPGNRKSHENIYGKINSAVNIRNRGKDILGKIKQRAVIWKNLPASSAKKNRIWHRRGDDKNLHFYDLINAEMSFSFPFE